MSFRPCISCLRSSLPARSTYSTVASTRSIYSFANYRSTAVTRTISSQRRNIASTGLRSDPEETKGTSTSSSNTSSSDNNSSDKMSHSLYIDSTPDEVKNAKGLHLLTMSTPNGQKVQIFLEELKAKYGNIEWTTTLIDIFKNTQKEEWYLRLNPNGRIPVLVDNKQSPPFPVMETGAVLLYLLKEFDAEDAFGFKDDLERNECLQWLLFFHGSAQPIQGQLNHFAKAAKEKIPYAIDRFKNELLRVYEVMEIRLSGKYTGEPRDYLAGKGKGKYSIADIGSYPWVKMYDYNGAISEEDMKPFPHLKGWLEKIGQREAVKTGMGEKYRLPEKK